MKSLKIRLELNNKQTTLARKHAGIARFAYNWGLAVCQEAFKNKRKRPSSIDLHKKFIKEEKSENLIFMKFLNVRHSKPFAIWTQLINAFSKK